MSDRRNVVEGKKYLHFHPTDILWRGKSYPFTAPKDAYGNIKQALFCCMTAVFCRFFVFFYCTLCPLFNVITWISSICVCTHISRYFRPPDFIFRKTQNKSVNGNHFVSEIKLFLAKWFLCHTDKFYQKAGKPKCFR